MNLNKYTIKCDCCGRFCKPASTLFVPDSDVSYEEIKFRCKTCTDKHGKPIPTQQFYWA